MSLTINLSEMGVHTLICALERHIDYLKYKNFGSEQLEVSEDLHGTLCQWKNEQLN